MSISFVAPRVPLVDLRTGTITREWYLLLQSLFTINGFDADTMEDLSPAFGDPFALTAVDILRDELSAQPIPQPLFIAADDVLPVIGALRDEIAMLRAEIDDLKKAPL